MSSTNVGFNFVPRKLNPYENELQYENQRLNTTATQNMRNSNNIQSSHLQYFNVLKQQYPIKLNENPIYDDKQQQFLVIQDQETDQEKEQVKEQAIYLENNEEFDELDSDDQRKPIKQLNETQQEFIRITEEADFGGSPIDLRKIQYEERDLKNINNIIIEIDKNERAIQKLKQMWPSSKLDNQKLHVVQDRIIENSKYQNEKKINQEEKNQSNIQWVDINKNTPSTSQKQTEYIRKSQQKNEKKSSQKFGQDKNDKQDIPIQNTNSKTDQNSQNNHKNSQNKNNKTLKKQFQTDQSSTLDENNSSSLTNTQNNQPQTDLIGQRQKLESQEGLRNILLRQTSFKQQEPWMSINFLSSTPGERIVTQFSRGNCRYSTSRSQSRNGLYSTRNNSVSKSVQSSQVSPVNKDNNKSFQFANDQKELQMANNKNEECFRNINSNNELPFEDGSRTAYYNRKRLFNNNNNGNINQMDDKNNIPNDTRRASVLKSRCQSRQVSRQNSPLSNEQQVQCQRVKTQQNSCLPKITNKQYERNFKTEQNQNDDRTNNYIKENRCQGDKKRMSVQICDSYNYQNQINHPYVKQSLKDFEYEQKQQNNDIEEAFLKQEQIDRIENYVNNFNKSMKGDRLQSQEDQRSVKTPQNIDIQLNQLKNGIPVNQKNDNIQNLNYDNLQRRRDSVQGNIISSSSKKESRYHSPNDNQVRQSLNSQNVHLNQTLQTKKQRYQDYDIQKQDEYPNYDKNMQYHQRSNQLNEEYKNQENKNHEKSINGDIQQITPKQMDIDIQNKQKLIYILNNKEIVNFNENNINHNQRYTQTTKKQVINGKDELKDSVLTKKKQANTEICDKLDSTFYKKQQQGEINVQRIFEDIHARKETKHNSKKQQKIYSYGDYTIIHNPKSKVLNLLGADQNNQCHEHLEDNLGEQMNDFLNEALGSHEKSKNILLSQSINRHPQKSNSPTRNHLNSVTNNFKANQQQQRSKSVVNDVARRKSSSKSKRKSTKKSQNIDIDEKKVMIL